MRYLAALTLLILGCQTRDAKEKVAPTNPPIEREAPLSPPPVPKPKPPPLKFTHVLAAYQTPVKVTKEDNREHNVALAAKQFDGLILEPGDDFSFNEAVGKRTKKRGFKEAPVIWEGILMPGVGGGTCQVSSTLHAALLHAGIKPTERSHHSRPSSYIDIGYDAAVSWPDICETDPPKCIKLDLKFENPFEFPIKLRSTFIDYPQGEESDPPPPPHDGLLIEILGPKPSTKKVDFRTRWHETEDFEVVEKPKGWGSRRVKIQDGRKGRSATLYITTTDLVTEEVTVEKLHSRYKPTNEIWEVGPDYEPPKEKEDADADEDDPEGRAGIHPPGGEASRDEEARDLPGELGSPR